MSRRLTVWGIDVSTPAGVVLDQARWVRQCRAIVAATSKAAAVHALNVEGIDVTLHHFNTYAAATGNETEIRLATEEPGHVLVTPISGTVATFLDVTDRRLTEIADELDAETCVECSHVVEDDAHTHGCAECPCPLSLTPGD